MTRSNEDALAIVGLACRFPGAPDARAFWRLLERRVDAIREVPPDRWDAAAYYHPEPGTPGKMNTRWGGFLDAIDTFDPQFFGISPREAEWMDPQQRLVLEVAHEALEDAAIPPSSLKGKNGAVFIGSQSFDYYQLINREHAEVDAYTATGNAHSVLANRISYLLDLKGPSLAVDTACSSGLVAVHLAARALRANDADFAIAGAVNLILSPEVTIALSQARMMSSDGRCKAFDARADGYVRGEGCGVIVIKRLADAIAAKDPIWAVLRGSAVNQDGRSNGLTAPNGPAQQAVIERALEDAGVEPRDVAYVEAHGTGTELGDPIELQALASVFGADTDRTKLKVGTVKTNIGHLESAAGLAGLIKVVLALHEGAIPPNLHFRDPNPKLRWDSLPIEIATTLTPWPRGKDVRIAGVSSFGFGGTNAHAIIEEAPVRAINATNPDRSSHVLALSGRTPELVREEAHQLRELLEKEPWLELADLAYTRNIGRDQLLHRAALVARSSEDLEARLERCARGERDPAVQIGHKRPRKPPKIAFLFTGQGSQAHEMGRALYATEPSFKETVDRCTAIAGIALASHAQLAHFVFEYALAEWWRSIGVEPSVLIGHSLGELVAATIAKSMSLEDAIRLVTVRGQLMQECGGAMAAVFARAAIVEGALEDGVSIAAFNEPEHTVISGNEASLGRVIARLESGAHVVRRLKVSTAFHSREVDPVLERFGEAIGSIAFRAPELPWIANVTGELQTEAPAASYWTRQIREPVQFVACVRAAAELGATIFLEIGPSKTLVQLARQTIADQTSLFVPSLNPADEDHAFASAAATLWAGGVEVDWERFDRAHARSKLRLPPLPYERQRLWFEQALPTKDMGAGIAFSLMFSAQNDRDSDGYPFLLDAARFADAHGFTAIWTQEQHFESIGGPYPNPSITAAAIAAVTKRIAVRGSIHLPLHHTIRIAEEWAMVDRLSAGRAGVAFNIPLEKNDYVFGQRYEDRFTTMTTDILMLRRAWNSGTIATKDAVQREIHPRPQQAQLPVWIGAGCQDERYAYAGALGVSVLIPLMSSRFDELARRIAIYRESWRTHAHPGTGVVTVMMHAFIGDELAAIKETVREPLSGQLKLGARRLASLATTTEPSFDEDRLTRFASVAFEHQFANGGLFGTLETALERVHAFKAIGIDELAFIVDYGLAPDQARASLHRLAELHRMTTPESARSAPARLKRDIAAAAPSEAYAAPSDVTEKLLVDIWSAVLRVPRVGVHDNFFELGGDSRLAIEIIRRALAVGLELDPLHVFEKQTIAELAEEIAACQKRT